MGILPKSNEGQREEIILQGYWQKYSENNAKVKDDHKEPIPRELTRLFTLTNIQD